MWWILFWLCALLFGFWFQLFLKQTDRTAWRFTGVCVRGKAELEGRNILHRGVFMKRRWLERIPQISDMASHCPGQRAEWARSWTWLTSETHSCAKRGPTNVLLESVQCCKTILSSFLNWKMAEVLLNKFQLITNKPQKAMLKFLSILAFPPQPPTHTYIGCGWIRTMGPSTLCQITALFRFRPEIILAAINQPFVVFFNQKWESTNFLFLTTQYHPLHAVEGNPQVAQMPPCTSLCLFNSKTLKHAPRPRFMCFSV